MFAAETARSRHAYSQGNRPTSHNRTAPVQCSVITPERLLAAASYRELEGAAVGSVRYSRVSVNLAVKRAGDACV
jgi:hypothetical protein